MLPTCTTEESRTAIPGYISWHNHISRRQFPGTLVIKLTIEARVFHRIRLTDVEEGQFLPYTEDCCGHLTPEPCAVIDALPEVG